MANYTQTLTILLNGEQARANIEHLQKELRILDGMLKRANERGDKNVGHILKNQKALRQTLAQLTKDTRGYEEVLSNLNGSSIAQLERAYRALRREVRNTNPALDEFASKQKQLKLLQDRIQALNGQARQTESIFARVSDRFNRYFGMVSAGIASVTGLSLAFRSAAQSAAEMDDIYSDVMKSTGLTRDEVVGLNEEFKKMDTRTSREELNRLAYEAGKLGIAAKEDVLAFVRAADQINVALGEDLGEGAITNIGKIADVFGLTDSMGIEKSLISIGSAINALGQDSTAAEAYLVEFTQRLAGVGAQARMSVQDLLGYASGLDQSAMNVEMAATAFQTFIMDMFSDTATFAGYANMEVKEFASLLNTDVNAAVMRVLTSLHEAGGFEQLVPMFKDMGADGARAVSVLASMASNIDAVRQAQELSNVEFEKATSLANEFDTKNNNRMAQLEKARKAFKDTIIEFGETLSPVLLQTTNLSTIAIKFLARHGKAVLALAGTYAALFVVYKTYRSWQTIVNGLHSAGRITVLALSVAYNRLAGNMTRAAAATKLLKAAYSGLGMGIVAAALTAVVSGVSALVRRSREATAAVRSFHTETGKLKMEADSLLKVIETSEPSTDRYRAAIEKLQETYGPYISNFIDEKGELTDIAAAREAVNKQIERSVGLRVQQEEIDRITEESLERQATKYEKLVRSIQRNADVSEESARMMANDIMEMIKAGKGVEEIRGSMGDIFGARFENVRPKIRALRDEYVGMAEDIDNVREKFKALIPAGKDVVADGTNTTSPNIEEDPNKEVKKTFEERLAMLEAQEAAEQLILKRSYAAKKISQSDYETLSEAMTLGYLQRRNALYLEYGEDNAEVEEAYLNALIKKMEDANRQFERLSKEAEKALEIDLSGVEADMDAAFNDLYGAELDAVNNAAAARDRLMEKWGQPLPNPVDVEAFRSDMAAIEQLLKDGMITYDQYATMVKNRKAAFAEDVISTTSGILNQAASLADSIQSLEMSQLEVQMNKELAMYGDTADKRAAIEQKYEQKKLDLQIKYADMNMAIQISQAIAAGALASVQAWTAAAGNPAIAGVFIGLIAATTAMQIASIVAQRNALKNQTLDSSSSSVQTRTVVDGYSEGGYTPRSSDDLKPVGVVHANEWVAPASMLRSYPMLFSGLEKLRQGRTSAVPALPFASGGYTAAAPTQDNSYNKALEDVAAALRAVNERMSQPIEAYTVLSQLQAKQELQEKHRKAASR